MTPQDIENKLRSLVEGEFVSFSLTWNDHSLSYQTIQQYLDSPWGDKSDWVSQEEKEKAIETNSMWTLQWYPRTPVAFYVISASSLEAIFTYIDQNSS